MLPPPRSSRPDIPLRGTPRATAPFRPPALPDAPRRPAPGSCSAKGDAIRTPRPRSTIPRARTVRALPASTSGQPLPMGHPEPPQEPGIADEIPPPEPTRFDAEPVDPLRTEPQHPFGRSRNTFREVVEQRPDTDRHPASEVIGVARDPLLLLRISERHQHDIGTCRANLFDRRFVVAEPIDDARDAHAGDAPLQARSGGLGHARRRPEQTYPGTEVGHLRQQVRDEIRAHEVVSQA